MPSIAPGAGPQIETFSYAAPEDGRMRRAVIRAIERATGQPHLKRLYLAYQNEVAAGATQDDFFTASVKKLRLHLDYDEARWARLPASGPLVVIANHPYGVLDGIVICALMLKRRRDFRILTNSVLYRAHEIREWLLPVDFAETREALATNLRSRAEARRYLEQGGALIVFPAGGVSTTETVFGRRAIDAEWKPLTARLILQGKAAVAPVFFHGQNSRLFQIASHISATARLALIFREVHRRIGTRVRLSVGDVIPFAELEALSDKRGMMDVLRERVHAMAVSGDDQ